MPNQIIHPAWDASYELKFSSAPQELVILLHGWRQTGATLLEDLGVCFSYKTLVLAPNAPYPSPYITKHGMRVGYGWYFFDAKTAEYVVPMDFGVEYVSKLVESLGYSHLPKRVVGFSQGGYLAPFVGQALSNVFQVITINARYRSEVLKEPLPFRMDAVHSMDDTIVEPERARKCHEEVLSVGNTGYFQTVKKSGHMITDSLVMATSQVLGMATVPQ